MVELDIGRSSVENAAMCCVLFGKWFLIAPGSLVYKSYVNALFFCVSGRCGLERSRDGDFQEVERPMCCRVCFMCGRGVEYSVEMSGLKCWITWLRLTVCIGMDIC